MWKERFPRNVLCDGLTYCVAPPTSEAIVSVGGGLEMHRWYLIGSTRNGWQSARTSRTRTFDPVIGREREEVKLTCRFQPWFALIAYGYREPTEPAVAGS